MNRWTLVARGLRFHRRTHLGVLLGCALSGAVLSGALFVGDSVRGSLQGLARARLGKVESVLDSGQRPFRAELAGPGVAPVLRVPGMALREGKRQVNRVEVSGIDPRFFALAEKPAEAPSKGRVLLNAKLAAALDAKAGDEIRLRVWKPGLLTRDAPLASRKERDTVLRFFTVAGVLSEAQLGRFSLKSDQAGPYGAFVALGELQELLDVEGRANLLVAAGAPSLGEAWTLEDAGLEVKSLRGLVQVQSRRIYLDGAVSEKALSLRPGAVGVLSYLVDSITGPSGRSTPYSFMTAVSPSADRTLGPAPADLKDDEILVNRWLADAIGVGPGDAVTVGYSELTPSQDFAARTRSFRVRAVVEMEALEAERDLFPEFPGLTDVDSCRDWDIGITLEEKKLKDPANEEYWKKHKETPKALVTLAAGRSMWANRYGDLMAVRFPGTDAKAVAAELRSQLRAEDAGLVFRAVRAPAERAVSESMDLGQLFLGMSFFLIVASLLLTAMLFVFTVEQRAREMGVLRAVGFRPAGVRRLFLGEGAVLAVAGSLLGVPLGLAFARALVWGLGTAWSGAVADAAISFHATALSGLTGAAAAAAISLLAMAVTIRRQARRPVRELVAEDLGVSSVRTAKGWTAVAGVSLLGAAVLAFAGGGSPGAFFGAGALMLIGGIALIRIRLGRQAGGLSLAGLGVRNASRRPGRGAATAAMLASGCFIVFSVSAFQEDLSRLGSERRSGTGGFELYGESSIAVHQDLNGEKGRAAFRLAEPGVGFVPLRVREGDDASCLNLNQAVAPTILGVDPEKLEALGAFAEPALWKLLEADGDAVPALVGDAATAVWKLKKKVGDVLDYRDERGEAFRVRLAGALPTRLSVLQGRILIANRHFTRLFPSEGGHRVFLIDAPAGSEERVIAHLSERLEAAGFEAVRSTDRLREFYAVESAYLRMFLVLGGLGLLLGTAGMAVLVLRNILERRSELALLRAVGFAPGQAVRVVLAEHRFLLVAGLIAGTAASAVAVGPAAFQPSIRIPWLLLAGFLAGTAAFALGWIAAAARAALRIPLVPALRHEA